MKVAAHRVAPIRVALIGNPPMDTPLTVPPLQGSARNNTSAFMKRAPHPMRLSGREPEPGWRVALSILPCIGNDVPSYGADNGPNTFRGRGDPFVAYIGVS